MAERHSLYEDIIDYGLYTPAGVILSIVEDLPGFVDKGRTKIASQLGVANVVGRMAFGTIRRRVESLIARDSDPTPDEGGDVMDASVVTKVAVVRKDASGLAIASYDSLAASQIVARLDGLEPHELEAIAQYEQANRQRRTILSRVNQLLHGGPNAL